jgi:hypothetical protein
VANLEHDYLGERDHKATILLWHAVISVLKWESLRTPGAEARQLERCLRVCNSLAAQWVADDPPMQPTGRGCHNGRRLPARRTARVSVCVLPRRRRRDRAAAVHEPQTDRRAAHAQPRTTARSSGRHGTCIFPRRPLFLQEFNKRISYRQTRWNCGKLEPAHLNRSQAVRPARAHALLGFTPAELFPAPALSRGYPRGARPGRVHARGIQPAQDFAASIDGFCWISASRTASP